MSSSEEETVVPVKRKKGIVHVEEYKKEKIKLSRVKGTAYTNYSGKDVAARVTGEDCR